jgi:hypothetical protein
VALAYHSFAYKNIIPEKSLPLKFLEQFRPWKRASHSQGTTPPPTQKYGLLSSSTGPSHSASMVEVAAEMCRAHLAIQSSRGGKGWRPTTCTPWKVSSNPLFATASSGSRASLQTTSTKSEEHQIICSLSLSLSLSIYI